MTARSKISRAINDSLTDGTIELRDKLQEIMNHYRTSDGTKVTKTFIDGQVRKAKKRKLDKQLEDCGFNFCQDCNINSNAGVYIDCSHDISVDNCQKLGRAELAYDENNITIRCRDCHNKHG